MKTSGNGNYMGKYEILFKKSLKDNLLFKVKNSNKYSGFITYRSKMCDNSIKAGGGKNRSILL